MRLIAATLLLALSACGFTPQGDMVRDTIKERGAAAYDAGIDNSLFFICDAASVGSVRRRFSGRMKTYNDLCSEEALKL